MRREKTLAERLWPKVDIDDPIGCWWWRGSTDTYGYGQVRLGRSQGGGLKKAHRLVYEMLVGPVPDGQELDHVCEEPSCVNPWHLEVVTHAENIRRGYESRAAPSHCPNGHEYTIENTAWRYEEGKGRQCRTCKNAGQVRRRKEVRDAGFVPQQSG